MSRTLLVVTIAACLFGTLTMSAKTPPKPFVISKDPQAMTIVQSALTAMGGANVAISNADSVTTATASEYPHGKTISFPLTIKTRGTRQIRIEAQKSNGMAVAVLNNGQGAIQRPDGRVKARLSNNTVGERVEHIPLFSMLAEYENPDINVQYKGTAQFNGQNTRVVALSFIANKNPYQAPIYAAMTQTLFYIDQTTGLVDKLQYTDHEESGHPEDDQKVEVYFSGYQTVDGIAVPFHQTTYSDGKLDSDVILNSVTFNAGVSDSDFVLPQ